MIRAFIYSLLALGVGAWLYSVLGNNPGYVLVSFGAWSLETTLVAMVLFLLLILVLIYGLYCLAGFLNPLGLLRGDSFFGSSRRRKKAAHASEEGLRLLLLGHWQEAYKLLVENADRVESPVFNLLAASLAAWQRGDNSSTNYCLEQAALKSQRDKPGIKTLKALLEYRSGKVEQSLAILLALDKEAPGSPYVLNLMKTIYYSVEDWEKLSAFLPELEKHKVIKSDELTRLRETIASEKISLITIETGGAAALIKQWENIDKKVRKGEEITLAYLHKLLDFSQDEEALTIASAFLKNQWSDKIVLQTGYIDAPDSGPLLMLLEKWLKSRPNNGTLMLSLGRASLRNKLWGKAREYFESALRFSKSRELSADANAELARLLDHLGEHAQSATLYGKAMEQLDHQLPELPMPD
jgi:HemY protein